MTEILDAVFTEHVICSKLYLQSESANSMMVSIIVPSIFSINIDKNIYISYAPDFSIEYFSVHHRTYTILLSVMSSDTL